MLLFTTKRCSEYHEVKITYHEEHNILLTEKENGMFPCMLIKAKFAQS